MEYNECPDIYEQKHGEKTNNQDFYKMSEIVLGLGRRFIMVPACKHQIFERFRKRKSHGKGIWISFMWFQTIVPRLIYVS